VSWSRKPVSPPSRERVPPGQTRATKFPVLHVRTPPVCNPHLWTLKVVGEVEHPLTLTWG
jgi:DMSO/TMAO reductase YedYZ molybdopterin-dependent catalytic subunit